MSEDPILMTQAQYARHRNKSPQYIAKLVKAGTYGRIFAFNRQSIVNDNLGAFSDIGRLFASASAQFEAQFLVDLITANNGIGPVMSDTKKLFDAAHGNLAASGATISDTTLAAARLALRSQKGLDGKTPLDIASKFLAVPAALETCGRLALFQTLRVALADFAKRAGCADTSPISPHRLRHTGPRTCSAAG